MPPSFPRSLGLIDCSLFILHDIKESAGVDPPSPLFVCSALVVKTRHSASPFDFEALIEEAIGQIYRGKGDESTPVDSHPPGYDAGCKIELIWSTHGIYLIDRLIKSTVCVHLSRFKMAEGYSQTSINGTCNLLTPHVRMSLHGSIVV